MHRSPPGSAAETAFASLVALDAAARALAPEAPPSAPRRSRALAHALLVSVAGRELQVPLTAVREVRRCPPLAPVPLAPPWLAGMCALDGTAVAVIELSVLAFDEPPREAQALLVGGDDGQRLALRIDAVLDTRVAPAMADESTQGWLRPAGDRLHLDLPALLADPRLASPAAPARRPRRAPLFPEPVVDAR